MVKVEDFTLNISNVFNKGIIILVPYKEKRVEFKNGSVTIGIFQDCIGAMYLPEKTLIAKSERKFLGKPMLSLNSVYNCNIYFIPTNLRKYRTYFTELNKLDIMYKCLCKKLKRYYRQN